MNSFAFLERGVRAEIERQTELLEAGGRSIQNAPLRPAQRAAQRAALQGGGARLPLLPGARPRADVVTEEMLAAARAAAARAAAARAARFEHELGLAADRARDLAFRAELGDYFERALRGRRTESIRASSRTGSRSWSSGSAPTPTRRLRKVTPEALATLASMVARQGGQPRRRARGADAPRREGRRSARDRRSARARARSAARTTSLGEVVDRAIAADPTPPSRSAPAT